MRRSVGLPCHRAAVLPWVFLLAACADASRITLPGRVEEPRALPSKQGPTGGRILYAAGTLTTDLFSMDADGSDVVRLTTAASSESAPAWAPDGKRTLFASDADNGFSFAIYIMNADGTGVTRLTTPPVSEDDTSPRALGPYVVFVRQDFTATTRAIWWMNDDGTDLTRLTSGPADSDPAPSPNGKLVAFIRDGDVHVVDAVTGAVTRLTTTADVESSPAWSPGGKQIAFAQRNPGPSNQDLFVMNADGTAITQLTNTPSVDERAPRWSPDGKRIAFSATVLGEWMSIWIMDADGTSLNRITPPAEFNHYLGAWAR